MLLDNPTRLDSFCLIPLVQPSRAAAMLLDSIISEDTVRVSSVFPYWYGRQCLIANQIYSNSIRNPFLKETLFLRESFCEL